MPQDRDQTIVRGNRRPGGGQQQINFDPHGGRQGIADDAPSSSSALERQSTDRTRNVGKFGSSQALTSSFVSLDSMSVGSASLGSLKASRHGGGEDDKERRRRHEEKRRRKEKKRKKKERREREERAARAGEEGKDAEEDGSLDTNTVGSGGTMDSATVGSGGTLEMDEERRRRHEEKKRRRREKKRRERARRERGEERAARGGEDGGGEGGKGPGDARDDGSLASLTVGSGGTAGSGTVGSGETMDTDGAHRKADGGEMDDEERRRRHEKKKRRKEKKMRERERREHEQARIKEGVRASVAKSMDSMSVGLAAPLSSLMASHRGGEDGDDEGRRKRHEEKKMEEREEKEKTEREQSGGRAEEGKGPQDPNDAGDGIATPPELPDAVTAGSRGAVDSVGGKAKDSGATTLESKDSVAIVSGSMHVSDRAMSVASGSVDSDAAIGTVASDDSDRAVGTVASDSEGESEERRRRREEKKRRKREKREKRERGRDGPHEEEGRDPKDGLGASLKSMESAGSAGSGESTDSEEIPLRKGSRRGGSDDEGEMDDEERRRREEKKRRKRKKKEKRERREIKQIMQTNADHSSQRIQFVGLPLNIGEDPPAAGAMDATAKTDEPFNPRMSGLSMGDADYSVADISKTSTIATKNYSNKEYLTYASRSKFKKGLKAKEKGEYKLAKSKFRQALKARILLHEDIQHVSIAPVHENIGLMDKELGDYEAATLGLMAALEITEAALAKLEEGGADKDHAVEEGEDAEKKSKKQQKLTQCVERIKKAMEEVEVLDRPRKEKAEMERKKAAEEAAEKRRKAAEAAEEERRKNAKDGEDASANQAAGPDAAGKKKNKSKKHLQGDKSASSLATESGPNQEWNKVKKKKGIIGFLGGKKSKLKEHDAAAAAAPPKKERRMSTASEMRQRNKYAAQRAKGEEYHAERQYAMAIASFNNAKFALLLVAGMAGGRGGGGRPLDDALCGLRDKINAAQLSERIVDCRVEQRVSDGHIEINNKEEDVSHVTYDQAVAILTGVRKELSEQVERLEETSLHDNSHEGDEAESANSPEEEKAALSNFKDLAKEAAHSLANIYTKQGCVFAKLGHPHRSLDSFSDSIASWAEAAKEQGQKQVPERIFIEDDPLILETQKIISSFTKINRLEVNTPGAYILKNTTHLEALGTALQMAISHHHLGLEAMPENATRGMKKGNRHQLETATYHYLQALKLASETQKLRASFDASQDCSPYEGTGELERGDGTFIGAAMSVICEGGRECALLKTLEQVCLSLTSFGLGRHALSKIWLMKAIAGMDAPNLSNASEEARAAMHILFAMTRKDKDNMASSGLFPIYQGSMAAAGYAEDPSEAFHSAIATLEKGVYAAQSAVAALEKGMYVDAVSKLEQVAAAEVWKSPRPPGDSEEVLYAIDAKIILKAAQGDLAGMHTEMSRRMDIVARWIGNPSIELAREFYRIACVESLLGNHQTCGRRLDQSLQLASDCNKEFNEPYIVKLRAVTCDALSDIDGALSKYESILAAEESLLNKARLMNAMAHIHLKTSGQSHIALSLIEKSMKMQQDFAKKEGRGDSDLLSETKILYGNAMASNNSLAKAIQWYDSALGSNPEKSPVHSTNLRALYNKGVSLFRNGDIAGADEAFGTILEEVGRTSKVANGTALVLNGIGSIYFANKDYDAAIQQFKESLILKNDELSPSQRAGTLCNIATAYYKKGELEDSAASFNDALREAESAAGGSSQMCCKMKVLIMSKLGHVMYRSALYLCAHTMFTEAASMGSKEDPDDDLSHRCDRYAEMCRLKLVQQNSYERLPKQKPEITAMKPRFEASLIPITDGRNATRYSDAVFSPGQRMLAALGAEAADLDTMTSLPTGDTRIACDAALQCLLKKVKDYQANYDGRLNSKFTNLKSLLRNELKLIGDK